MKKSSKTYKKPGLLTYTGARIGSFFLRKTLFHTKYVRNELRGVKGPFVLIANHECALDFVNVIGASSRRMTFVLSDTFYRTLPIPHLMNRMRTIHKQQFCTVPSDLNMMKEVINHGGGLVLFPAGLMCEDGLSTPIPSSTYRFLQWLGADIYVARTEGDYFVMPKWSKKKHPGKTFMDIFKLMSAEEAAASDVAEIQKRTDEALLFDSYRNQEAHPVRYRDGDNIEGLENVLYSCPFCEEEFSLTPTEPHVLTCSHCGKTLTADTFGFLHTEEGKVLFPSDISRMIYRRLKKRMEEEPDLSLSTEADLSLIDDKKHSFVPVGHVRLTLTPKTADLDGTVNGEPFFKRFSLGNVPMLPFTPGKCVELQDVKESYRLFPAFPPLAQKLIHYVKAQYELNHPEEDLMSEKRVPISVISR